jgi:hypothetical protein
MKKKRKMHTFFKFLHLLKLVEGGCAAFNYPPPLSKKPKQAVELGYSAPPSFLLLLSEKNNNTVFFLFVVVLPIVVLYLE